jgi:hypothetical protein
MFARHQPQMSKVLDSKMVLKELKIWSSPKKGKQNRRPAVLPPKGLAWERLSWA